MLCTEVCGIKPSSLLYNQKVKQCKLPDWQTNLPCPLVNNLITELPQSEERNCECIPEEHWCSVNVSRLVLSSKA